jgi:hypothetical protein
MLGTMGRNLPVYSNRLEAQPYAGEAPEDFHPPPIESLAYPFDLRVERALTNLGDLGILGDVTRLRQGVIRDMEEERHLQVLEREEQLARDRVQASREYRRRLVVERGAVLGRLTEAKVFLCLSPHLKQDKAQGDIPFPLHYHVNQVSPGSVTG